MKAARTDLNHTQIIAEVNAVLGEGAMRSLAKMGDGWPDAVLGWGHRNWFYEFKTKGGRVNEKQERFRRSWAGQYSVVESSAAVLRSVGVRV